MSIDGPPRPAGTRPDRGRVLSFLRRAVAWVWRLGDRRRVVSVLALAAAGMFAVQLCRPIHDVDIFWQLKLGELTLAGGLPQHEPFLAGKDREPLAVVAWLGQVVYAGCRQAGGWPLLWLADAAVWFGGFVVVAAASAHGRANVWPAAVGLWVGWLAALPTASLRPQSFSALAFGLFIVLLRSNLSIRRTGLLGLLLFAVWQNLHPSVVVAGFVLAGVVAAEVVQYFRGRRPTLPWRLLPLAVAAGLATILTPAGMDVFRISAVNADVSLYLGVAEWRPLTWQPLEFGRAFAWAGLALTAIGVAVRGRRLTAGTFAAFLVLTAATLVSHRFVLYWGIAVIPVWDELLSPAAATPATRTPRLRTALAGLVGLLAVVVPLRVSPVPFAGYYPFTGLDALARQRPAGVVFSSYYWGGLVTDSGYPDWRPTHDGRYYLFTRQEWDEYFATVAGGRSVEAVVARYLPAGFFLRPGSDDGLIQQLRAHAGWRELHADAECVVFVPRSR